MLDHSIWYHGSKMSRWNAIAQQGLLANPEKRAWSPAHSPGSFHDRSLAAAGGVYMSRNLMTASGASRNGLNKEDKSDELLLIVQWIDDQATGLVPDEDELGRLSQVTYPGNTYNENTVASIYQTLHAPGKMQWEIDDAYAWLAKAREHYSHQLDYIEKAKPETEQNPERLRLLREACNDMFELAVARAAAWVAHDEKLQKYKWSLPWTDCMRRANVELTPPDPFEAEEAFRQGLNRACEKLSFLANPQIKNSVWINARSLKNIGWTGPGPHIHCALHIHAHRHPDQQVIEILAGKPPPDDFLQQWEERMGYRIEFRTAA